MVRIPNLAADVSRFCDGIDADAPDLTLANAIASDLARVDPLRLTSDDRERLTALGIRFEASLARANAWVAGHAHLVSGAVVSSRLTRAYHLGSADEGAGSTWPR